MQPSQDYPFFEKTDTVITLLRTLNYNVRAQNMAYHLFLFAILVVRKNPMLHYVTCILVYLSKYVLHIHIFFIKSFDSKDINKKTYMRMNIQTISVLRYH